MTDSELRVAILRALATGPRHLDELPLLVSAHRIPTVKAVRDLLERGAVTVSPANFVRLA